MRSDILKQPLPVRGFRLRRQPRARLFQRGSLYILSPHPDQGDDQGGGRLRPGGAPVVPSRISRYNTEGRWILKFTRLGQHGKLDDYIKSEALGWQHKNV
jgi:hypothetical protein